MPFWARQTLAVLIALVGSGVCAFVLGTLGLPSLAITLTAGLAGLGLFYLVRPNEEKN